MWIEIKGKHTSAILIRHLEGLIHDLRSEFYFLFLIIKWIACGF